MILSKHSAHCILGILGASCCLFAYGANDTGAVFDKCPGKDLNSSQQHGEVTVREAGRWQGMITPV